MMDLVSSVSQRLLLLLIPGCPALGDKATCNIQNEFADETPGCYMNVQLQKVLIAEFQRKFAIQYFKP